MTMGKRKIDDPSVVARFEEALRATRSIKAASEALGRTKDFGRRLIRNHPQLASLVPRRGELSRTHGLTRAVEYGTWTRIKDRCHNLRSNGRRRYGQNGIVVCARWAASFEAFLEDMGRRPEWASSIDRIDPLGNYSCGKCDECAGNGWPANCRWATPLTQAQNRTSTTFFTSGGETRCLNEWARVLGISQSTLWNRLDRGWSIEKTLSTPRRVSGG